MYTAIVAACFSGDVKDPASTYPWGMLIAVVLVFISTFIPVLVGIGVSDAPFSGTVTVTVTNSQTMI